MRKRKIKRMKKWSDISILEKLKHPGKEGTEILHETSELTFLGNDKKPDFANLKIYFYPNEWDIELKSLKQYLYQFRNKLMSYERLIDVIYYDLMYVFKPRRLRLILKTNTRGGISSTLKADSDWKSRGGKEEFKDWIQKDE